MNERSQTLLSLFDPTGLGLEIGPSYNPLVPKAEGYRVETVDYASREDLVEKYRNDSHADIARIEEVDHVTGGRSLLETIPHEGRYDFIVASHVIEHTPDMIDFLESCAHLLKPSGSLVLAVPDKRFCFDLLQPLSTTGAVIQASLDRRRRPSPGTVFDSVAYDVLRDGMIGWPEETSSMPAFHATLEAARGLLDLAGSSDQYIDVHVWRFVPSSFRLIVEDLHALGRVRLRERRFVARAGHEFFVALSRQGSGPGLSRIALAVEAQKELAAVRLPD